MTYSKRPLLPPCVRGLADERTPLLGSGCLTAKDLQAVGRRIWREEVGDGAFVAPGSIKELDGPLGHPRLLDVSILTGSGLFDVLTLEDQSQRLRGSRQALCCLPGFFERHERVQVVVTISEVVSTVAKVAPDPVLKDFVPYVAATC